MRKVLRGAFHSIYNSENCGKGETQEMIRKFPGKETSVTLPFSFPEIPQNAFHLNPGNFGRILINIAISSHADVLAVLGLVTRSPTRGGTRDKPRTFAWETRSNGLSNHRPSFPKAART